MKSAEARFGARGGARTHGESSTIAIFFTYGRGPTFRNPNSQIRNSCRAFEEIIRRPHDQEEVLRELAVRCLAPA
jgi:hypothetical protein